MVDDEKDLCAYLKRELGKEGYEVAVAYDGTDGLEYFKNNRVDVVISGIRMPKMNGLEMVDEIRKVDSEIPIIYTTAFNDSEYMKKTIDQSIVSYIIKPIDIPNTR